MVLLFFCFLRSYESKDEVLIFFTNVFLFLCCAADISEVSGKEQAEQQQTKKGRGRRQ
jgi:hypothetical protein